jgi:hypothetical protein
LNKRSRTVQKLLTGLEALENTHLDYYDPVQVHELQAILELVMDKLNNEGKGGLGLPFMANPNRAGKFAG